MVLDQRDDLYGALQAVAQAVTLEPHSAPFQLRYSQLLFRHGDNEAAIEAAGRAAALKSDAAIYGHLGHLLGQTGRLDEAETATRRASELAPEHAGLQFQLSHVLARQGKLEAAVAAARRAADLAPDRSDLLGYLNDLVDRMERHAKAAPGETIVQENSGGPLPKRA
jgi:tetratricopeptide (TPR) repeat protein